MLITVAFTMFHLCMYFMRKSPFDHLNQDKELTRVVVKIFFYFCFILDHEPTGLVIKDDTNVSTLL